MPRRSSGSPLHMLPLVLAMTAAPAAIAGSNQPAPGQIERVQAFAERYRRDAPSLVAEERYLQNVTTAREIPQTREMTSELVMVRLPGAAGWVMLRDVQVVDRRRLQDREQRLLKLLQSPQADAFARAQELARESSRYNLGRITRTINVPDVAIEYLLPKHTGRMKFETLRSETIDGAAVDVFRFNEVRGPSIVRDPRGVDLLAQGRVWADRATGEIVRTELILRERNSSGTNVVDFRADPRLSIRVPVKMTERYVMQGESVEAVATYTNFRSFSVATTEKVSKPPQESMQQSVVDGVVSAMCQKQIVLLGEQPTHGEALGFDTKSKIIDGLIGKCGFTGILFEAGVYDFIGVERATQARSATQEQLDNAIGRFWWTRELAPWRGALFERTARKQLVAGGLDDQVSITSHYAQATLPKLVAANAPEKIATECEAAVSRNVNYTYDEKTPFDDSEHVLLKQCAHRAADASAADGADRVMLENFARFADRQRQGTAMSRDESMYRNLSWYLDRLPANSRVVVWTASVHAARQRGALPEMPLGARAVQRWGDRVGSIGFTAFAGQTSRAARPAAAIPEAPAGSLEAVATTGSPWALLDAGKLRSLGPVASRLMGRFITDTWSDYFDAVVVIRQEVAPTFDPWK